MKSLNSGDTNNSCAEKQLPDKEAQTQVSNKNIKSLQALQKTTKNFEKIYSIFELIAKENDFEAMSYAVKERFYDVKDQSNQSIFHQSCLSKNFLLSRLMIEYGIIPNEIDQLNYAIQSSKDMRYALKIPHFGMKVNDIEGMSVLTRFSTAGYNDIVKLLLTVPGIDSEDKDHWGYTAINWASREGHPEVVRTLLTVPGINVNTKDSYNGWTPLMNASREGHHEVAKLLLAVPEIKIGDRDISDGNALEWALRTNNYNIAKLIRAKMNK